MVNHSVLNSLAVLAVAYMEHMNMDEIQQELANFSGVKRRFSETDIADTTIIDDYAHHPSEIKATIDAARQKYPDREVIAVFQPHTYSRLAAYINGFAESLSRADKTFVTPIFGSIRENAGNVSSALIWSNGLTVVKVLTWIPWTNFCNTIMRSLFSWVPVTLKNTKKSTKNC